VLLQLMVAAGIAFVGGCGFFPRASFWVATTLAVAASIAYLVMAVKEWRLVWSLRQRIKGWLTELEDEDANQLRTAWHQARFMPICTWWLLPMILGLPLIFMLMQVVLMAGQLFAMIIFVLAMGAYRQLHVYQQLIEAVTESQSYRRIARLRL
jgi:hypothetical protein